MMEDRNTSDKMNRYLLGSIVTHAIVFAIFFIGDYFKSEPTVFESAVKVDLVGLPDKLPQVASQPAPPNAQPPAPAPEKASEPEPPPTPPAPSPKTEKPAVALKKEPDTKAKQKSALTKLKQLNAIDKLKNLEDEEQKQKNAEKLDDAFKKLQQFKGNQLSSGTSTSGSSTESKQQYLGSVDQHIRAQWALPQYLRNRSLEVSIAVKINEKGDVIESVVVKPSGNDRFDQEALMAIERASPVPAPPDDFRSAAKNDGFVFRFRE